MKKEIVKIILAASLALNLAFACVWIYRLISTDKDGRQEDAAFSGQYELRGDQNDDIDAIVRSFRIKLAENKSSVLEKRIDIVELLGSPGFDARELEEKLSELNGIENELNSEFISTLLAVGKVLDEGQWIKFLYNISRGWFFSGAAPGS